MKISPLVFYKIKTVLFYSIASVVIIIALGISGVRLVLTTANLYQEEVEQLASSLLEQPVKIGRMDAKLSGLIPTLIFHDVQLLSEKTRAPLFSLARVDVGVSYEKLILEQEFIPELITVRGLKLHVTRTVEGNFKIKGIDLESLNDVNQNETSLVLENWLQQNGEIGLEDSSITWVDEKKSGINWFFDDIDFLLKKTQGRYQLLLSSKLPRELGKKIELSFDLNGNILSPSTWELKAYIESKGFNIEPINKYVESEELSFKDGIADIKLWLDWDKSKLKQFSGGLKLYKLSYKLKNNKKVQLNYVSGIFDSRLDENNKWNVSVDKFNYKNKSEVLSNSKFSLAFKINKNKLESFDVKANYLKLDTLSKIVVDNHLVSESNENIINHINISGEVHDFYISWKGNKLNKVTANFNELGVNAWENIPKIMGLSGNIFYKDQEGGISLFASNNTIGFPRLFREEFQLEQLNAEISFSNTKEGLFFDTKSLHLENTEVAATASAKLWLPNSDASPYLDLQVYISRGDVSKVSHFLPVTIMEAGLVDWLDKSLVKGKLNKGTIILNGKLNEFPFDNKEGIFLVETDVSDFTLEYLDGWPKITKANIVSIFTGQGLNIHLTSGEAENNILYDSYASIESYFNAELDLNISSTGSLYTWVQYLINSPILLESEKTISAMRFSGDVVTDIKINVPLGDEVLKEKLLSYSGSAKFSNASVFMLNDKIDITNGLGTLFFTEKGLSSKNMVADVFGEKSKFSVSSDLKNKDINIAIKGKIKPGIVLKRFDIPGAKNISGITSFKANMFFPSKIKKNVHPTFELNSNLFGVKSDFPDFLYKKKNTRNQFYFKTIFSGVDKIQFDARLGRNGSAVIELDQSGESNYLNRGAISFSSEKAVLPKNNILYVDGSINKISPAKWLESLDLKRKNKGTPFFINPIIFNLDTLKLFSDVKGERSNSRKNVNPGKLPRFEGIVKKLYFNDIFLGRLDFKTSQRKQALHFDEIILSAKNMKLFSHGDWSFKNDTHKTNMNFTLSSNDFGGMLGGLNFSEVIRKGKAQSSGRLKWWGAPSEFSLDKLNGDVQLKIEQGNIKEVDAGVGRILGLFSLTALPRKLLGDFNDAFKSGFSFDVAEGEISIEDGDAYTDDFEINSPVAEISISGRTGLADRDYENIIEVVPDVGGGLAGITALLVNLPAGIGLWLIDKLTGEQINAASSNKYEMSGSWDAPEIEEIIDEP